MEHNNMADTIGDLIDRLTISNIRLWMLEDERRLYCNTDSSKTEEETKKFLNKISGTNRDRNDLIDQINASFRVLIDKSNNRNSTIQLTINELLGTGKNKFYKTEDS
jgi:hypothetical protein